MTEMIIRKVKSLPPMPESVAKVREICDNPEGTIRELVPIIKEDPMFTADILKAANSPLYGFSRQITSIDQAISLFGMGTIQGFAISYAVRKSFKIDLAPYGVGEHHLIDISSKQNALAQQWGRREVQSKQSEMMTISLLMELGKAVAAIVLEESGKAQAFTEKVKTAETMHDLAAAEKEFLGITSEWIAALMFKHWQFNETMIEMIRFVANPDEAPESVRTQAQVLHVVKEAAPFLHPFCEPCVKSAYEKAEAYGFNLSRLEEAIAVTSQ